MTRRNDRAPHVRNETGRCLVVVVRGGHEYVLNSARLARWGIRVDTPVPAGGEISRYYDGALNGELIDAAKNLCRSIRRPRGTSRRASPTTSPSIRHPGGAPDQYELLAELKRRGELRIRVNFTVSARAAPARRRSSAPSSTPGLRRRTKGTSGCASAASSWGSTAGSRAAGCASRSAAAGRSTACRRCRATGSR